MAVKASPEAIREMKKDISNTIRDIERISRASNQVCQRHQTGMMLRRLNSIC